MEMDTANRIFLSYIDKSRNYYQAQGFGNPYRWAHHSSAPFVAPRKPLAGSRIALVTTAMPMDGRESQEPIDRPRKVVYAAPTLPPPGALFTQDLAWDKEATHTRDLDSFFPVHRLLEFAESGRIGSVASRYYGVPTEYSQRTTVDHDAPEILHWCREDGVDAVLLVGL